MTLSLSTSAPFALWIKLQYLTPEEWGITVLLHDTTDVQPIQQIYAADLKKKQL